jgi:hypothetical protein
VSCSSPTPKSVTPPEKMVETAIEKGLDVICVTDHNEIQGAWQAERCVRENNLEIEVVAGEEITSADGEVLGLFLQGCIPRDLSAEETIELIHDQGGLAVAPHPFSYRCPCHWSAAWPPRAGYGTKAARSGKKSGFTTVKGALGLSTDSQASRLGAGYRSR